MHVFRFNGASVKVRKTFYLAPLSLWAGIAWISQKSLPGLSLSRRFLVGFAGMLIALSADIGHAFAHTYSAKYAQAPMDEILLSLDMPRTIYYDNDVEPRQHILRALGGPIYNFLYLVTGTAWRFSAPPGSASRFLAGIVCLVNGLLFAGSLFPLPMVDGGSIRKWGLVLRGVSESEAEKIVRKNASFLLGLLVMIAGVFSIQFLKRGRHQK